MIKIRLARYGRKKLPFYRLVAADSRSPVTGKFKERLGTYNPLLPKESVNRVLFNIERIKYWISVGGQCTERVSKLLKGML